jgi:hypothetical protein
MMFGQDFSADVTAGVIEDSRFKKLDAFSDLACAVRTAGYPSSASLGDFIAIDGDGSADAWSTMSRFFTWIREAEQVLA